MTEQSHLSKSSFDLEAIVNRWYEAVAPIAPGLDVAHAKSNLTACTQQAIDLLLAESFEAENARAIGETLAREISAEARVLGKSQQALAQQFGAGLPAERASALQPRLINLLSEMAVGFVLHKEHLIKSLRREFLSATSHELRSPLNAIIGFSRVILKGVDGPTTDLQEQDLTAVYEGGKKLLDLINETFNIEKIDVGKAEFELKTFDLEHLVEGTIEQVRPLAKEYGNRVEAHYTAGPGVMHSDPDKVQKVLRNLLSYAATYTRQGRIEIAASREAVGEEEWVRLQIADTGVGMTPEQIQRFTETGNPNTLEYGDIGLTVSQRYCQALGGEITLESEVGKGATFTVRLPARSELPG